MLSPINGDLGHLGEISLFTGSNDIILADAKKLRRIAEATHPELLTITHEDETKVLLSTAPGNTQASAAMHVARTVCRRAERRILALCRHTAVNAELVTYVNRLSDALYALARFLEGQQSYMEW